MNERILIFTDNLPYGKSEPFLEAELEYLIRYFDNVSVFPFEKGRDRKIREIPGKIELITPVFNNARGKSELIIKGLFNSSSIFRLLEEGLKSKVWKSVSRFRIWATHFLIIRSLLKEIKQRDLVNLFNRFDIIYFYWGLRWSQIIPFLSPKIRSKIIVRFHGSDLYEYTNKNYIPWRHEQLSRIDKAVVISENGKKYIESQYPFLKEKIIVSRIGTKDYGLNPYLKAPPLHIVSCSNLVLVKRVFLIIKTLFFLKISVIWTHFGDGPQRKEIEEVTAGFPENISCRLAGAVTHEELVNFYRTVSVDLFINLSSSEGVPVSIMEAMSFGIPVIATAVGGTPEIVSEKNGLLIEPDFSPEELAGKIIKLSERDDLASLRKASREEWSLKSNAETVYPPFINFLRNV